jgi:hypothetical protein
MTFSLKAPKFIYRKKLGAFTRKTNRVKKDQVLNMGEVAPVRYDNQEIKSFPYSKPMMGYERVFVGYGREVKRGRHKRSKGNNPVGTTFKPFKREWQPYISTYGSIDKGMKYGSKYRNRRLK